MTDTKLKVSFKQDDDVEEIVDEILIVDDSATVLAVATKMLEEKYVVNTAANGLEAWEMLQANRSITLVFSDMQMPMMNGLELLLNIRNSDDLRLSKLPVVMITGKTDTAAGKRAVFDIGATDFIGKPFDALDLESRARAHVNPKNGRRNRISDMVLDEQVLLASASSFHSVGCQALEFSRNNDSSITVVYIEIGNYAEIEDIVGKKTAMSIMLTVAKRVNETVREEDVSARLGVNKLAVLYSQVGSTSSALIGRLLNHLNAIEFEYDDEPLKIDIHYGYENSNPHGKDVTFSEICMRADSNLDAAFGEQPDISDRDKDYHKDGRVFGATLFDGFRSHGKKIGLWFALKSAIDGDFDSIADEYVPELVARMKSYIKHVEESK